MNDKTYELSIDEVTERLDEGLKEYKEAFSGSSIDIVKGSIDLSKVKKGDSTQHIRVKLVITSKFYTPCIQLIIKHLDRRDNNKDFFLEALTERANQYKLTYMRNLMPMEEF